MSPLHREHFMASLLFPLPPQQGRPPNESVAILLFILYIKDHAILKHPFNAY